jgi:hypothetical protein
MVVTRANVGHIVARLWSGHLLMIVPRHVVPCESYSPQTAVLFRACLNIQGPSAKRTLFHQSEEDRH